MKNSVELQNIKKSFGEQHVLNGINLTVERGEIVGLLGPSGAGKSTVIKTMLGMEKADSGKATVLATKMPNRKILEKIGYMAQSDALYETLSGRENMQFFGAMKGISKENLTNEIDETAKIVDLTQHLDKRAANYSGGMKRRLSLAISLLNNPPLLVLDEPTVGIDPALKENIWNDLHKLRNQGTSVLITTHAMDEAELVDKIAMLIGGRIVEFDTPQNLKNHYHVDSIEKVFLAVEEKYMEIK